MSEVSDAADATEVTELIVYIAGEVAPLALTVTADGSELAAPIAPLDPSLASAVRLLVTADTVLCNDPSAAFCASTCVSDCWSSVRGTTAVCTALFRICWKLVAYCPVRFMEMGVMVELLIPPSSAARRRGLRKNFPHLWARVDYATFLSLVTRPTSTHSTTKMFPA